MHRWHRVAWPCPASRTVEHACTVLCSRRDRVHEHCVLLYLWLSTSAPGTLRLWPLRFVVSPATAGGDANACASVVAACLPASQAYDFPSQIWERGFEWAKPIRAPGRSWTVLALQVFWLRPTMPGLFEVEKSISKHMSGFGTKWVGLAST